MTDPKPLSVEWFHSQLWQLIHGHGTQPSEVACGAMARDMGRRVAAIVQMPPGKVAPTDPAPMTEPNTTEADILDWIKSGEARHGMSSQDTTSIAFWARPLAVYLSSRRPKPPAPTDPAPTAEWLEGQIGAWSEHHGPGTQHLFSQGISRRLAGHLVRNWAQVCEGRREEAAASIGALERAGEALAAVVASRRQPTDIAIEELMAEWRNARRNRKMDDYPDAGGIAPPPEGAPMPEETIRRMRDGDPEPHDWYERAGQMLHVVDNQLQQAKSLGTVTQQLARAQVAATLAVAETYQAAAAPPREPSHRRQAEIIQQQDERTRQLQETLQQRRELNDELRAENTKLLPLADIGRRVVEIAQDPPQHGNAAAVALWSLLDDVKLLIEKGEQDGE